MMRLAAALEVQLQWLQPLLTPNCCEAFTLTLLDKLVAMMEVLLGRKVRVLAGSHSVGFSKLLANLVGGLP